MVQLLNERKIYFQNPTYKKCFPQQQVSPRHQNHVCGVLHDPDEEMPLGLGEVKCPSSKKGLTISEACKDPSFFLDYIGVFCPPNCLQTMVFLSCIVYLFTKNTFPKRWKKYSPKKQYLFTFLWKF